MHTSSHSSLWPAAAGEGVQSLHSGVKISVTPSSVGPETMKERSRGKSANLNTGLISGPSSIPAAVCLQPLVALSYPKNIDLVTPNLI